jgi:hypothetical protein
MKCVYTSASSLSRATRSDWSHTARSQPDVSWNTSHPPEPTSLPLYLDAAPSVIDQYLVAKNSRSFLSDEDLCHYYLSHLDPVASASQSKSTSLQGSLQAPLILSRQSKAVYHSLLAVSAIRLAWDMTAYSSHAETNVVYQVLLRGYQHYDQASSSLRNAFAQSLQTPVDVLITSTLILLPFAAASQQIHHWISSRNVSRKSHVALSSTPRDVITFAKGARIMLEMLPPDCLATGYKPLADFTRGIDLAPVLPLCSRKPAAARMPASASVSTTIILGSAQALSELGLRLECLYREVSALQDHELIACRTAFEVLQQIRHSAVSMLTTDLPEQTQADVVTSAQKLPWLRAFIRRPCELRGTLLLPTEPLTRLLLSFYAQVPQGYLDLVLPLLDQRLERPVSASSNWFAPGMTKTQAFALDVYTHWSVFMFLVEEQSWWIGKLPLVTLTGVVNRYGNGFVSRLWPECENQATWWPGEILRTLQDIRAVHTDCT